MKLSKMYKCEVCDITIGHKYSLCKKCSKDELMTIKRIDVYKTTGVRLADLKDEHGYKNKIHSKLAVIKLGKKALSNDTKRVKQFKKLLDFEKTFNEELDKRNKVILNITNDVEILSRKWNYQLDAKDKYVIKKVSKYVREDRLDQLDKLYEKFKNYANYKAIDKEFTERINKEIFTYQTFCFTYLHNHLKKETPSDEYDTIWNNMVYDREVYARGHQFKNFIAHYKTENNAQFIRWNICNNHKELRNLKTEYEKNHDITVDEIEEKITTILNVLKELHAEKRRVKSLLEDIENKITACYKA